MAPGRVVRALDAACRFAYRRAAAIVAQSAGMMARLEARGVPAAKLHCIRNWSTYAPPGDAADGAPDAVRAAFAGRINLVYGGNIGQAQGLRTVIDAVAAAIRARPDLPFHLHLFGDGIERAALAARIGELGLADRMTLHGAVSRGAMDRIFDLADILVLHLKADPLYEVTIPSKTQHYLSCGKPIVAGLSGEAADLLRQSGAAIVTPPEDTAGMTAAILALAARDPAARDALGKSGRAYYDTHLSFAPAIDRTLAILGHVARTPQR
jgi:glycosyltransferase involved in cell wall biosynthesis